MQVYSPKDTEHSGHPEIVDRGPSSTARYRLKLRGTLGQSTYVYLTGEEVDTLTRLRNGNVITGTSPQSVSLNVTLEMRAGNRGAAIAQIEQAQRVLRLADASEFPEWGDA